MKKFIEFIREQGVVGLAVGFVLGGSVSKVVTSLVNDIINPLLSIVLGSTQTLADKVLSIGTIQVKYGNFLAVLVDFVIIAFVVYYVVRGLGIEKIDKKK